MTTPTGKTALPLLQGLFAVTVWGASFIATKIALQDLSPMTIVVLRFFFGILVVAGAVVATGQFRRVPGNDVGYLALLGFIGISFHQWLQSTGLQTAQASTTAWLVSTTPVFMAILAYFMLKEKISILQAGGIFVAFAGVLLVVTNGDLGALTAGTQGGWGDLLVLVSAPNWALFSILSRRMLESYSASLTMLYVVGRRSVVSRTAGRGHCRRVLSRRAGDRFRHCGRRADRRRRHPCRAERQRLIRALLAC